MMITGIRWALLASVGLSLGCTTPTLESRHAAASPAITALREGHFDRADALAAEEQRADADDPYTHVVRAIVRYEKTMTQLAMDGRTVLAGGIAGGGLNQKYLRTTLGDAETALAAVDADLAVAARQPGLSLELCVACWDVDWNGDGRVDDRDRRLLEIEQDAAGEPLPEGDPRRRPTFHFDDGDVPWARAFVGFERAALDVLLAYDWSEVPRLGHDDRSRIVVRLIEPARIADARQRILEGLDQSDAARRAYLAETDDDREWVPSPRQKSHPVPLPATQVLYDTWEGVVGDVRRLVRGEEGIRLAELLELGGEHTAHVPHGYLDVGHMLSRPADLVLDLRELERLDRRQDVDAALTAVLGDHYVRRMKASPLPGRLARMKGEVDRHEEGFERKLRYLLWLN